MENLTTSKEETREELKKELSNKSTAMENTICKLEKAAKVLNHWGEEYGCYGESPDPRLAVSWSSGVDKSKEGGRSFKWFYDYDLIRTLINIVDDYVNEAKIDLELAVYRSPQN